jgi:Holliday junction resolvasome RuvABC endonuclease subunit
MKIKDVLEKNMVYSRVMGIDMSSQSIAFSVFDKSARGWDLSFWGKMSVDGEDTFARCGDVIGKFTGFTKTFNPGLILFESSTYVNNNAVMKQLSMVFGAAAGVASRAGANVLDIPPITWQSHIGNSAFTKKEKEDFKESHPGLSPSQIKTKMRELRKQRNMDFVENKFGVTLTDDDIADAVCIGYYATDVYGGQK